MNSEHTRKVGEEVEHVCALLAVVAAGQRRAHLVLHLADNGLALLLLVGLMQSVNQTHTQHTHTNNPQHTTHTTNNTQHTQQTTHNTQHTTHTHTHTHIQTNLDSQAGHDAF